jgi:hypothetical protein
MTMVRRGASRCFVTLLVLPLRPSSLLMTQKSENEDEGSHKGVNEEQQELRRGHSFYDKSKRGTKVKSN